MFKIYAKNDAKSLEVKQNIEKLLNDNNYIISNQHYKFVITIGGDGTFLQAVHDEMGNLDNITVIAINTGHLGFYTEMYDDFEEILNKINTCHYDRYYLLEAQTLNKTYYALNEFCIQSSTKTTIFDYYIAGEHLQTLRGGGVIVSTPQGSTAMSKTYGGAVIYPNSKSYQITEMSSLNNNIYRTLNSSLVLTQNEVFELKLPENDVVSMNFDVEYNYQVGPTIKFKVSEKNLKVMHLKKSTFTKRIKDGFIK